MWWHFLHSHHREGQENLDRPPSNYDVAGIPTGSWEDNKSECFSLLSLHKNILPSCFFSFFCPCLMWAQIVVRAQIPLLIALKNSIRKLRRVSGYGFFVTLSTCAALAAAALLVTLLLARSISFSARSFLLFFVILILGGLLYLFSHTRVAFKAK
jgi:hypothetical protein